MVVPNLIAVFLLAPVLLKLVKKHFGKQRYKKQTRSGAPLLVFMLFSYFPTYTRPQALGPTWLPMAAPT